MPQGKRILMSVIKWRHIWGSTLHCGQPRSNRKNRRTEMNACARLLSSASGDFTDLFHRKRKFIFHFLSCWNVKCRIVKWIRSFVKIQCQESSCISALLAPTEPSFAHYRMTCVPLWTKRKRTLSWSISTITPLLHWHSNLLWLTLGACAHFQSQSVVISPKISSKHHQ